MSTDGPTPERIARANGEYELFITDENRRTERMLDGSVLDLLNNRGSISNGQYSAGVAYYRDAYLAGLMASGVIDPSREVVDGGTHKGITDIQLDAHHRWQRATKAIGKTHSNTLICILLHEELLKDFGLKLSGRSTAKDCTIAAVTAVQLALLELDNYYCPSKPHGPSIRVYHGQ